MPDQVTPYCKKPRSVQLRSSAVKCRCWRRLGAILPLLVVCCWSFFFNHRVFVYFDICVFVYLFVVFVYLCICVFMCFYLCIDPILLLICCFPSFSTRQEWLCGTHIVKRSIVFHGNDLVSWSIELSNCPNQLLTQVNTVPDPQPIPSTSRKSPPLQKMSHQIESNS